LFVITIGCGCYSSPNPAGSPSAESAPVTRLAEQADYPRHVGKRVEVIGVVTDTKCPQVCGIDAWSLDSHRGRRLKLRGTLRETVVTQETIDEMSRTGIANRGAGRFYSLDDMEFEVLP
jgi:hypothetical protein